MDWQSKPWYIDNSLVTVTQKGECFCILEYYATHYYGLPINHSPVLTTEQFDQLCEQIEKIEREIHPNIVQFIGVAVDLKESTPKWIIYEKLMYTLKETMQNTDNTNPPIVNILDVCKQICTALVFIHKLGSSYGHLSVDSILLGRGDVIKLFSTGVFSTLGNERKEKISPSKDIYDFGCVLLSLVTSQKEQITPTLSLLKSAIAKHPCITHVLTLALSKDEFVTAADLLKKIIILQNLHTPVCETIEISFNSSSKKEKPTKSFKNFIEIAPKPPESITKQTQLSETQTKSSSTSKDINSKINSSSNISKSRKLSNDADYIDLCLPPKKIQKLEHVEYRNANVSSPSSNQPSKLSSTSKSFTNSTPNNIIQTKTSSTSLLLNSSTNLTSAGQSNIISIPSTNETIPQEPPSFFLQALLAITDENKNLFKEKFSSIQEEHKRRLLEGIIHYGGYGLVPQNLAIAVNNFEKASTMGCISSLCLVAYFRHRGFGCPCEKTVAEAKAKEGLRLNEKNPALNDPVRMFSISILRLFGIGCEPSPEQALEGFRKSANQFIHAKVFIGYILLTTPNASVDISKDAFGNIQSAARAKVIDAYAVLAKIYERGNGCVNQNLDKALKLYQIAASLDHSLSLNNIGVLMEYGKGIDINTVQAAQCYKRAADLGNSFAMNNLGSLYHYGKGVPKDYAMAFKYYHLSASQGNKVGCANLGLLYELGNGVKKDINNAIRWYLKAAEKPDPNSLACNNLGKLYFDGKEISEDFVKAKSFLEDAMSSGSIVAINNYGLLQEKKGEIDEAIKTFRIASGKGYQVAHFHLNRLLKEKDEIIDK